MESPVTHPVEVTDDDEAGVVELSGLPVLLQLSSSSPLGQSVTRDVIFLKDDLVINPTEIPVTNPGVADTDLGLVTHHLTLVTAENIR